MADRELRTSLRITGDAAGAVKAAQDAKAAQEALTAKVAEAAKAAGLAEAALDRQTAQTGSLAIQTALARKALQDMAEQGISKASEEYKALEADIRLSERALKEEMAVVRAAEAAHNAATKSLAGLEKQHQQASAAIAEQEKRLQAVGVDVKNLAGEYDRLTKAQAEAIKMQAAWARLNAAGAAGSADIGRRDAQVEQMRRLSAASVQVQTAAEKQAAALEASRVKAAAASAQFAKLGTDATRTAAAMDRLGAQGSAALKTVAAGAAAATIQTDSWATSLGRLAPAAIAAFATMKAQQAAAELATTTKAVETLDARLQGLSKGSADYAAVQKIIATTADEQHKSLLTLGDAEARLLALEKAGLISRQQNIDLLRGMGNAAREAGADNAQLGQVMYGLGQALASPVVHAEELSQVVEPLPGLLQKLDEAAGLPAGGFRQLVNAGEITNKIFAQVLVAALKTYADQARSTGQTIAQAEADVENASTRLAKTLQPVTNYIVTEWAKVKTAALNFLSSEFQRGWTLFANPIGMTADKLQDLHDGLVRAIGANEKAGVSTAGLREKLRLVDEEMAKLQRIAPDAFSGVEQGGQAAASGLNLGEKAAKDFGAALTAALAEADGGAGKLDELIQQFDLLDPANVDRLAVAVGELSGQSASAAREVRESLVKAFEGLNATELQTAITAIRAKIDELGPAAGRLGVALDAAVGASLKKLGLDAGTAFTGVSDKIREMLETVKTLPGELDAAGVSGARAGDTLRKAWANIIDGAKTTDEFAAIAQALRESGLAAQSQVPIWSALNEAQRKVGVSGAEVRAAQDQAGRSMASFSKAVEENVADVTKLDEELARHPVLQSLAAQAARDAAEALRLQSLAANSTAAEISKLASQFTAAEQANSAFGQRAKLNAKELDSLKSSLDGATESLDTGNESTGQAISLYGQLREALGQYSTYAVWQFDMVARAAQAQDDWWLELEFAQQELQRLADKKAAVDALTARIQQATETTQGLAAAAQTSVGAFAELNAEQLEGLQSAIDAARDKLEDMRGAARGLSSSLADDLASVQAGDNAGAQAVAQYRAKLKEINEQMAAARKAGDAQTISELSRAMKLAGEIYQARITKVSDDYKQKTGEAAEKAAEDIAEASRTLSEGTKDAVEAAAKATEEAAAKLAEALLAIEQSALEFGASIDDKIRGIGRDGMSAQQAQADQVLQLQEKIRAAGAAIQAGQLDYAKSLRDSIVDIAEGLAKAGGKGKAEARAQAIAGLQAAKAVNEQLAAAQEQLARDEYALELEKIDIAKRAKIAALKEEFDYKSAGIEATKAKELAALKEVHDAAMKFIREEGRARQATSGGAGGRPSGGTGGRPSGGTITSGFAAGGIATGPTTGYTTTLHGTEAVVPLPDGRAIPVSLKLPPAAVNVPTLPSAAAGPSGTGEPEMTVRLVTDRGAADVRGSRSALQDVITGLKAAGAVRTKGGR